MCKIKTSSAEEIARFLDAVLLDGVFRTGAEFCSAEAPSVRCAQKHLGVAKLCEKVKNMFSLGLLTALPDLRGASFFELLGMVPKKVSSVFGSLLMNLWVRLGYGH